MALFKKKSDPIAKQGKELKRQITQLEEEIRRLSELQSTIDAAPAEPPAPAQAPEPAGNVKDLPLRPGASSPRLRSTALPHGPTVVSPKTGEKSRRGASHEPIFEEVKQNPFRSPAPAAHEDPQELGIRRDDLASSWQRLKNHFRGPVTSNPKLVNYLAAGSIQGLRPLRYERRVARNRFIVLVVVLVLILWGILALILKR